MISYPFSLIKLSALFLSVLLMLWMDVAHSGSIVSNHAEHPFSHDTIIQLSRELSQEPFKEPEKAPESLTQLEYSTYRKINFQQNAAIWGSTPTKFSIQLFAPGSLFKNLVDIDVVENARAYPVKVSELSFKVPNESLAKILLQVGKYAGIRLHYPINRDDYKDEFIVFQGASYFRAISKGQIYGLSTRGLAIDIAQPKGEEFPLFKRFWIERPGIHQKAIVVHALLDSMSVTGAYRFGIYPGSPTRIDVDVVLFPRRDIQYVGLAPLTSMFMHGSMDKSDNPDYRPAVHDSEALAMARGNGERLWRPLNNPQRLQISAFMDENPNGFGLIQRHRQFDYYQDLEAQYDRRPSAWVEPLGDWGKGHVELVEIPSDSEANDNIVAYWRPAQGLKKGQPFSYSYRLTWPDDAPPAATKVRVVRSAGGQKLNDANKEIVIDYSHLSAEETNNIQVEASISKGRILESHIEPNPNIGGARVFVSFDPENADVSELRVQLKKDDKPVGATWLYRWIN
jgi:periplasmic glucans biosynthesis protein